MKRGLKIGLIVGGSVLFAGGIGLATWLLLRKKGDESGGKGTGNEKNNSLSGTMKKGESGVKYTFVEVGSGKQSPQKGEKLYALLDCDIEWQNDNKAKSGLKNNFEEWTEHAIRGQEIGVAYNVTNGRIMTDSNYQTKLPKNQRQIKQNVFNAGKIGVLRDKNGNAATLTNGKSIVGTLTEFISSEEGKELGKIIASAVTKK